MLTYAPNINRLPSAIVAVAIIIIVLVIVMYKTSLASETIFEPTEMRFSYLTTSPIDTLKKLTSSKPKPRSLLSRRPTFSRGCSLAMRPNITAKAKKIPIPTINLPLTSMTASPAVALPHCNQPQYHQLRQSNRPSNNHAVLFKAAKQTIRLSVAAGGGNSATMGLHKQYMKVGQTTKNSLFGINDRSSGHHAGGATPLQMLISQQGKINHVALTAMVISGLCLLFILLSVDENFFLIAVTTAVMFLSADKLFKLFVWSVVYGRLAVIMIGLFTLAIGIILSSIPWVDYILLKNLKLWNGTLSYHYWQKPGVVRLTKVYIFNVTNPDNFLNFGEKPKLAEIGPFVYREDMEKVNIKFHDNGTVTYQHRKILQFVPELSVSKAQKVVVPNIPLLTLSSQSNSLGYFIQKTLSMALTLGRFKPFVTLTADELVFGYDDSLVSLAHKFYPKHIRPMSKMGLLLGRNGTLNEVSTIYTGHTGMENFGLIDKLNGLDKLPYWDEKPCNSIRASEGSFFPPRDLTKANIVYVYDKDLCRILPLEYRYPTVKNGINADFYTPPENIFDSGDSEPDNKCFCPGNEECPVKGLQNIAPCQYDAPVYISFPHFYKAEPSLLEPFDGLAPKKDLHETYFKIQPKLGVPVEGKVRIQLNFKVEQAKYIAAVSKFPSITFPVMWLEEGIDELTPSIRRWIYLATVVADSAVPVLTYGLIVFGCSLLIFVFVRAYKNVVFTKETIEMSKRTIRRGSSFIVNGQHRLMIVRDSYSLLSHVSPEETQSLC